MKRLMTLMALLLAGSAVNAQCTDLFFSEYIEGSSSNKAFEIFNPTPNPIDLSDYVVYRNNNGSLIPTDSLFPSGILNSLDVYVTGNPSANAAILAVADTTHTLTFYNGDDAVWLKKISTGDTLDIIGEIGVDPGVGWPVGAGSTSNFTLIRMMNVQQGITNWAVGMNQWDVYPIDMVDSLNAHSMIACGAACTNTSSSFSTIECDVYIAPDGASLTTTGIYVVTIPNAAGCDSVITIDLTINNSTASSLTETACGSYTLNATTYTFSGVYTQSLLNSVGCDSIITLNLDITPIPSAPNVVGTTEYCAGDTTTSLTVAAAAPDSLIISGVADATLAGGLPKAIEFYALYDITDLSTYGFGSANNGGGTDGEEFTFPSVSVVAGTYIHVATDSANFFTFYGIYPDYVNGSAPNINGDDAIELFHNGAVIDVFGDINVDGTGEPWEYLDGWAYRATDAVPNGGVFIIGEWLFSGPNALDGAADNATSGNPFPIETFTSSPSAGTITWYSDPALNNVLNVGPSYTPATGTGTVSYYITETNVGTTTCESPATQIDITFNPLPAVGSTASALLVCEGENVTLNGTGVDTYVWDNGVADGVPFAATTTTLYTVTGTDTNGCSAMSSINIEVNPAPAVSITSLPTLCIYDASITLSQGSPAGGTYSGNGVTGSDFDPGTAGIGTHVISYSYTDTAGCTGIATTDIVVDGCIGLEEIDQIQLTLFPNPAKTAIHVNCSSNVESIEIYSLSGVQLERSETTTLSVVHLARGMYVLKAFTDAGVVTTNFIKE